MNCTDANATYNRRALKSCMGGIAQRGSCGFATASVPIVLNANATLSPSRGDPLSCVLPAGSGSRFVGASASHKSATNKCRNDVSVVKVLARSRRVDMIQRLNLGQNETALQQRVIQYACISRSRFQQMKPTVDVSSTHTYTRPPARARERELLASREYNRSIDDVRRYREP